MGKSYNYDELQKKIVEAMKDPKTLYRKGFVNYSGYIKGTKTRYSEYVAQYLLEHRIEFDSKILTIQRKCSYKTISHDGTHNWSKSNQIEKEIAVMMKNHSQNNTRHFDYIGRILDYEVPLSNTSEYYAGKIDLLSWDGESLVIIELKKPGSFETLLRCILEAYTYRKTVANVKLAEDFGYMGVPLRAAALVFADSKPHKNWRDENQPYVKELMKQLGVSLYVLDNEKDLNVTKVYSVA